MKEWKICILKTIWDFTVLFNLVSFFLFEEVAGFLSPYSACIHGPRACAKD